MGFNNIYTHNIVRVGSATFEVVLGDSRANAARVTQLARVAADSHTAVLVFPRDCLTGTTAGSWGENAEVSALAESLDYIARQTADLGMLIVVGTRVGARSRSVFINGGCLCEDGEFPGGFRAENLPGLRVASLTGEDLVRGVLRSGMGDGDWPALLVNPAAPAHTVGSWRDLRRTARELSRELGIAVVQSVGSLGESSDEAAYMAGGFIVADGQVLADEQHLAAGGLTLADVILPELPVWRGAQLVRNPGIGSGAESGFSPRANHSNTHCTDNSNLCGGGLHLMDTDAQVPLLFPPAQRPLVPTSPRRYRQDLAEAFDIQVAALERRLAALQDANIVLGLSGGLDSTLSLLVAVAAKANRLAMKSSPAGGVTGENHAEPRADREGILAFTLPGFATSSGTKNAALRLAAALGVNCETIDIRPTATQMLQELGHPAGKGQPVYDVTFENVQAGLRADYLFRLANQRHGFVLGTGDLSEEALGWCTYGVGDHMSHYVVNSGIPKSLMPDLIRVAVDILNQRGLVPAPDDLREVTNSIIAADITPELIPDHADSTGGAQHQTTEGSIGPYLLHDFFLYHTLHGAEPRLVAFLALAAFTRPQSACAQATPTGETATPSPSDTPNNNTPAVQGSCPENHPESELNHPDRYFTREEILKWLRVFYRRFLTQQFKRTTSVAGPAIWPGMSLSPRTGYAFPSDLSPDATLASLENLD